MIILVFIGQHIYRDFGYSWDEKYQQSIAKINYNYVTKQDPTLLTYRDRYYGPFFELLLYSHFEQFDFPDLEYMRHRAFFLIFCAGLVAFYGLAYQLFKKARWALLAAILLAISPRIFADAFYNAKDIPLMVTFIFAGWFLVLLSDSLFNRHPWPILMVETILVSIATAAAISTRILGIILIPIICLVLLIHFLREPKGWLRISILTVSILILTLGFAICFWPILRIDPIGGLIAAFTYMSHYPFNPPNLYFGRYIPATNLPWHYLPVWISITNPLLLLVGLVISHLVYLVKCIKNISVRKIISLIIDNILYHPQWIGILAWAYAPIMAILVFNSILYDGWRQVFFIYPAFVLLATAGIKTGFEYLENIHSYRKVIQSLAICLIALGVIEPVWFMVQQHPHENVYFNLLAGRPDTLRYRFEMDYWGLSYKQAIDYLLANDSSELIKINVENSPGRSYLKFMLTGDQAKRVKMVGSVDSADYYITNYRLHPQDYPYPEKFYSISVRGSEIIAVYKLR